MTRTLTIAVTLCLLAIALPAALATNQGPGPVLNGDFEIGPLPGGSPNPLAGSAADRCIGVGHQVFWGTDSPQHAVLGDSQAPEPSIDGAQALAQSYQDGDRDPVDDAVQQSGATGCVHDNTQGKDILWIDPVTKSQLPAFWTVSVLGPPVVEFGFTFDDDPDDREARILADPSGSSHNMWQSFASAHQAWSANFEAYAFQVEAGAIAENARVEVGFALSPSYQQHPFVGAFWEGGLVFGAEDMDPDADGWVKMDPATDATIRCPDYEPCRGFKADFEAADEEGKRELLGQVRIVQNSFWSFNGPVEDDSCGCAIVIDNVAILGATTVAEELARGNLRANPVVGPPDQAGIEANGACQTDGTGGGGEAHVIVSPSDQKVDASSPDLVSSAAGAQAFAEGGGSCDQGALGVRASAYGDEAGVCVTDKVYVQPEGADCWDPEAPNEDDAVAPYPLDGGPPAP